MSDINAAYQRAAAIALEREGDFPDADVTLHTVREVVLLKVKENEKKRGWPHD